MVFLMDPGLNVVRFFLCRKTKVGLIPSLLFTRHVSAIDPSRVGVGKGSEGGWWGVGGGSSWLCCSGPASLGMSRCSAKSLVECLHRVLRDSHWEHSALLRCGQFSFFQFWLLLPQSLCFQSSDCWPQDDPLEKNVNYLHASSLPQICHCVHMSFA